MIGWDMTGYWDGRGQDGRGQSVGTYLSRPAVAPVVVARVGAASLRIWRATGEVLPEARRPHLDVLYHVCVNMLFRIEIGVGCVLPEAVVRDKRDLARLICTTRTSGIHQ